MKPAVQYGLLLGGTMVALPLLIFGLGLDKDQTTQNVTSFLNVAITGVLVFMGIREQRHTTKGFINFGTGFSTGMRVTLISAVISSIFSYFYFAFINPGIITFIRMRQEEEMLNRGMSEESVAKMASKMETWTTPGMMTLFAFLGMILIGLVVSLISAAILKKENPSEQIS